MVDVVRIDHFIGFLKYWQISADALTAIEGRWMESPGHELFSSIFDEKVIYYLCSFVFIFCDISGQAICGT